MILLIVACCLRHHCAEIEVLASPSVPAATRTQAANGEGRLRHQTSPKTGIAQATIVDGTWLNVVANSCWIFDVYSWLLAVTTCDHP